MSKIVNNVWVEKYRPASFSEMVLTKENRTFFETIIANNNIPNLMLTGAVRSGKTTIARILINSLDCEYL